MFSNSSIKFLPEFFPLYHIRARLQALSTHFFAPPAIAFRRCGVPLRAASRGMRDTPGGAPVTLLLRRTPAYAPARVFVFPQKERACFPQALVTLSCVILLPREARCPQAPPPTHPPPYLPLRRFPPLRFRRLPPSGMRRPRPRFRRLRFPPRARRSLRRPS